MHRSYESRGASPWICGPCLSERVAGRNGLVTRSQLGGVVALGRIDSGRPSPPIIYFQSTLDPRRAPPTGCGQGWSIAWRWAPFDLGCPRGSFCWLKPHPQYSAAGAKTPQQRLQSLPPTGESAWAMGNPPSC
jgi:hypothetical protein